MKLYPSSFLLLLSISSRGAMAQAADQAKNFFKVRFAISETAPRLYTNVSIGSPPQTIPIDLCFGGLSWVPAAAEDDGSGRNITTFYILESDTIRRTNDTFQVTSSEGNRIYGRYLQDRLEIGGKEVPEFLFGVTDAAEGNKSCLGLTHSPWASVSGVSQLNILNQLKQEDIILSQGYSIYFDGPSTGVILFGAIDGSKFQPPLETSRGTIATAPVLNVDGISLSGRPDLDDYGPGNVFFTGLIKFDTE
ncbi:hypothetical protein TWF281_011389 [Arthrobotrys megalospora]